MNNYESTRQDNPAKQRPKPNGRRQSSDGIQRSKILLMGLRRSGKTSIQQVLFNNLLPKQTFYLEPNMRIVKHRYESIIPLEIWDCPGNIGVESIGIPLSQFSTIIFVIDIRDLYNQPISKLVELIVAAHDEKPTLHLEIFVHKSEKLQEDDKIENFRQIHERVSDRLIDLSAQYSSVALNFHLTSVYDHTLHEAFSRVIQKLVSTLPYLEDLLNVFCANSQSPKAFLFDTNSRLYVATDASPVDSATHNLCCDYLEMLASFGPLYKSATGNSRIRKVPPAPPPSAIVSPNLTQSPKFSSRPATPSSPTQSHLANENNMKSTYDMFYPSASTSLHPATPGTTLTYHKISPHLALLSLLPTSIFEERRGLIEYNVVMFRDGVRGIWETESELRGHTSLEPAAKAQ